MSIHSFQAPGSMVGLDLITDPARRAEVRRRLEESGRTVITLSNAQIAAFAGNIIELTGAQGRVLALSSRAAASLTREQQGVIEKFAQLLPLPVPTIELAGGSVRCMLAGVHLSKR